MIFLSLKLYAIFHISIATATDTHVDEDETDTLAEMAERLEDRYICSKKYQIVSYKLFLHSHRCSQ